MTQRDELTDDRILEIWYEALGSEIGVIFEVTPADAPAIKVKFNTVRREHGDPRLSELAFHLNGDHKSIMIYHKTRDEDLP